MRVERLDFETKRVLAGQFLRVSSDFEREKGGEKGGGMHTDTQTHTDTDTHRHTDTDTDTDIHTQKL